MKNKGPLLLAAAASFLFGVAPLDAETAKKLDLTSLLQRYLPGWGIRLDGSGNVQSVVTAAGKTLDLLEIAKENPAPSATIGYWYSPTMDLLGRERIKARTAQEAVAVIQLWHTLWRGSSFTEKKLYEAHPFDGGWVIQVDHDFTNYPGSVQEVMPYELLVDRAQRVTQFRQRCYYYQGSAAAYTNTVISVYEREKQISNGIHYPEVLEKKLRNAWEKESKQTSTKPGQVQRKQ